MRGAEMFFPVMLNIEDKKIVVVGGGAVALRKVKALLAYGAGITVISPTFTEGFDEIWNEVQPIQALYREELIEDADIVIAATSSRQVNKNIREHCRKNMILCNTADDGEGSDFTVPSTLKRGGLVISVSTSGKSPALARKIKDQLEQLFTEEYGERLELLGVLRGLVLEKCSDEALKRCILNELTDMSIEELMERRNRYEACDRIQRE
ncbi:MAG: bifunctional precorrin-2 dehydrogenase/sirohydrochlorin ferrochelatase [Bacillota bacterium]|nr:bifunctional precorrin-2 dehydrogenase/sirohydrochlorin ferrochelatase [Bacillota bacterium]